MPYTPEISARERGSYDCPVEPHAGELLGAVRDLEQEGGQQHDAELESPGQDQ
jgi:hypothetical protein